MGWLQGSLEPPTSRGNMSEKMPNPRSAAPAKSIRPSSLLNFVTVSEAASGLSGGKTIQHMITAIAKIGACPRNDLSLESAIVLSKIDSHLPSPAYSVRQPAAEGTPNTSTGGRNDVQIALPCSDLS